jgi:hypothetical protein
MMCVFRGCRCLLSNEMPHTTCRSPVGYLTDFQDSVRIRLKMRPQPLNLRRCPRPQDLDNLPLPFAITVRSLVGREAGTTRSLRRLVFPFRAPEPPFVPRRTVSQSRPPPIAVIARFHGRPGLAWFVRHECRRDGYQAPSPLIGLLRLSGPCPHLFWISPGTDQP